MVADGGPTNLTVTCYGLEFPGCNTSHTVPVDRQMASRARRSSPADSPVVILPNLYTDSFAGDQDVLYNGAPLNWPRAWATNVIVYCWYAIQWRDTMASCF